MQNVNIYSNFDVLSKEISIIKTVMKIKLNAILVHEEVITDLSKEEQEVTRENDELREKNRNLFHSLSNVRGNKVVKIQDEKSSLITALRLMQRENK